ncbi:MAG: YHS domain-containing protein [Leptolyngbya sp. PLA3]|nr:MAG: YHS domain-containing protein [Cyanobacteria bacterium CYA]MCE7969425.1 YHS domain-containing protein [Leptolyngbya sp. PL-A3]
MQWLMKLTCVAWLCAGAVAEPINRYCPVGKEPIDNKTPTIKYEGHEIGLCCPGCGEKFLGWDEQRRNEFVKLALAGKEPRLEEVSHEAQVEPAPGAGEGYPFTLTTCPVAGHEIDHEGEPVVYVHEGREVKFCCEDCLEKFQADPDQYLAKIDEQMIEQQAMHYPLSTCIISGESLMEDGKFTGVNVVYRNRLVRFCCEDCAGKFEKDPGAVLAKLDKAMIEAQRASYPLQTCVVSGEELGGMGEPVEMLYMNRLVRFCCEMCIGKFEKDPAAFMAKIDAAYAEAQRAGANTTCPVSGEDLDDSAVEVVAGQKLVRFCCEKCVGKMKSEPDAILSKVK